MICQIKQPEFGTTEFGLFFLCLHDPTVAARVAKANIRTVEVRSWTGATHSLPMEFPKQVDRELLNFMAANEMR